MIYYAKKNSDQIQSIKSISKIFFYFIDFGIYMFGCSGKSTRIGDTKKRSSGTKKCDMTAEVAILWEERFFRKSF